jgi:peptidoglycan/xylan/chitin deacetylase (PgdA/CDA1 family)
MPSLREIALASYYVATRGTRRRAAAERAAQFREPVRILFYHRVADHSPNPWTMSCKSFARQMEWLRTRYDLVTLAEAQSRIASGRNSRPTACITFDDGYSENHLFAIPLLLKNHIPFTYFVATDFITRGVPFPHDAALGRPLAVNTWTQLRELAAAGIEIGAHTRTHADLGPDLHDDEIVDEVVGSKHELERGLDRSVHYFAFPYGQHKNLSASAFRIAAHAGFDGVCSAYGGYNFPGDDAFHLRRFHADEQFIRFMNWMTVDRRKLRLHTDFDPGDYQQSTATSLPMMVSSSQTALCGPCVSASLLS